MVETNVLKGFLPTKLLSASGDVDSSKVLENDLVGFYFSAHWCPPCRKFTPFLAEAYKEWKKDGKKIEIVFVTSDRDEKSFKEYFAEMPWTAINIDEKTLIGNLKATFKITGIPSLIVLDKSGKTVDDSARSTVTNDPSGAVDIWLKKK